MATGSSGNWWHRGLSLVRLMRDSGKSLLVESDIDPFPLGKTLRGYGRLSFLSDLRAAGNGMLLAVPQSMAFAVIAGLPLYQGIMCAAVAAVIGPLFASSRHTILGPTNATAFMIFSFFAANPQLNQQALMPMLVFMTAGLLIFGAFLRVADLAQYISRTVMVAYITGAALQMIVNQLPAMMGVSLSEDKGRALSLPGVLWQSLTHVADTHWPSLLTAMLTLGLYALLSKKRPYWPNFAIVLTVMAVITSLLRPLGFAPPTFADQTFGLIDLLPQMPDFVGAGGLPSASRLFGIALALAFLATLEHSVMAKTLAGRTGRLVNANQDMLSVGVSNLACSYLSGMPASGSLTRSTLNYESGARTGLASIFNGLGCLVFALLLGSMVGAITKASLAALVVCVAVKLINKGHIRISLFATESDAFVFIATFIATMLVPLHVAIFVGVGLSIMLYLRKASRPHLIEYAFNEEGMLAEADLGKRQNPSISIVHVEGDLFFGAAELFRTQIQLACTDPNLRIIVLRLRNARHLDATSVMAMEELIRVLRGNRRDLIISGATKDVYRVLKDSGLVEVIGKNNIFPGSPSNPNLATRNALKRAQEILGRKDADVRIYFDPAKVKSESSDK